jgi:hypothetical protein
MSIILYELETINRRSLAVYFIQMIQLFTKDCFSNLCFMPQG